MTHTWLDRNRHLIFAVLVAISLGGAGIFYFNRPNPAPIEVVPGNTPSPTPEVTPPPALTPTPAKVRVYITGAIAHADVYFLPRGSIVKDVVLAAGGFTPDADPERINQALELKDQQHIHIPRLDEENPPPPVQDGVLPGPDASAAFNPPTGGSRINLNTAGLEELDALPGIGPAIARRIIDYREQAGGFKTVEEVMQVSGIGQATFAKIKDMVTVE